MSAGARCIDRLTFERVRASDLAASRRGGAIREGACREQPTTTSACELAAGLLVAASLVPERARSRIHRQRVEYFKGAKLVDALIGPRYKGKLAKETPIKTRAEAAKLAQELLRVGYIHRSQRVQHAHSRRWELELFNAPFEEDGLFTWVYEGSKTKLYLMCGGMLVGALGLCMVQIWPLWLKVRRARALRACMHAPLWRKTRCTSGAAQQAGGRAGMQAFT